MRILFINDHIHFGGGGDAVLRLEREAYEEAGYETYTFSHSSSAEALATDHDYVQKESSSRLVCRTGKFLYAPNVYRELRKVLNEVRPHVVRAHLVSKYPEAIYAALQGENVIQTLHGPNLFCTTSWGNLRNDSRDCELGIGMKCWQRGCASLPNVLLYSFLDHRLRPKVNSAVKLFHCPSKHIQEKAKSLGYGPTIHIPLGIDESFMNVEMASHKGPSTILYVGALAEEKGLLVLPEALQLISQKITDVKLVFCGRGTLEGQLRHEFERRGLADNVKFEGFVPHNEIVKHLHKAHVLVLPSIWAEQFGLVGPEALACGVPCVASRVGGIPEWLKDGEWGFLTSPRDATSLADSITSLLENEKLRLQYGSAGRHFARTVHNPRDYKQSWLNLVAQFADSEGR